MSKTSIALAAIVVLGTTLLAAAAVSQGEDPAVLLRAAIEIEEVDGNLEAAIGQYKHVIQIAGTNRVVAAQALLRLGGCYEKRGPEEARRAYEQLIRDYAEQAREVAAARQRLAALQRPAGAGAPRDMAVRRVLTFEGSAEGSIDAAAALFSLTDWDTGNLAVRELPGGNLRRLTNKGPWTASPEFTQVSVPSRDGRQIAYDWVTKEGLFELRVVALDGSGARVIHDGKDTSLAHPCDWSPDGTHILAVLASTDQHTSQAVLISVKDGSRRSSRASPPASTASSGLASRRTGGMSRSISGCWTTAAVTTSSSSRRKEASPRPWCGSRATTSFSTGRPTDGTSCSRATGRGRPMRGCCRWRTGSRGGPRN